MDIHRREFPIAAMINPSLKSRFSLGDLVE